MKLKNFLLFPLFFCFIFNAEAKDPSKLIKKVTPSLVKVVIVKYSNVAKQLTYLRHVASGVAVKHNIVATNCSVFNPEDEVMVVQGDFYSPAEIFLSNKKLDLCILKVKGMALKPVKLRPSQNLKKGDEVYVINRKYLRLHKTSKGIVSSIASSGLAFTFISDSEVWGGPLFDVQGNLIGIARHETKSLNKVKHAVASNWIIEVLDLQPHSINLSK